MNIKQLTKLANFIEALPVEKFDMGAWVNTPSGRDEQCFTKKDMLNPSCGTTACLGGWTVLINGYCVTWNDFAVKKLKGKKLKGELTRISIQAAKILGLEEETSDSLFYADNWPPQFKKWDTIEELQQQAVARIRFMIKTGG